MPFRKEIDENLRFLVIEVRSQLQSTRKLINQAGAVSIEKINSRDDYIDNLKGVIENKCFSQIYHVSQEDKETVDLMKAVINITSNLERIADYFVNIVSQTGHYQDKAFINRYPTEICFNEIEDALNKIYEATFSRDLDMAVEICRAEYRLDEIYRDVFTKILGQLQEGKNIGELLTTTFIFRYLERVGDCLQNIGESIISAAVGEKLKIHQYQALKQTLQRMDIDAPISDFAFESIWETRSGCRIARIRNKKSGSLSTSAIFKEGRVSKLRSEKENIERWQRISPGLTPRVFGFQENGQNGSLLLEYLAGATLEELLLGDDRKAMEDALGLVKNTLLDIWSRTEKDQRVNAGLSDQLLERIEEVHRVHPNYTFQDKQIGSLETPSYNDLLEGISKIDDSLFAPFTVLIHGDFNIDNIIYNRGERRIHFIDLHRSREQDYVQDVSVFIVSAFRIPIGDPRVRNQLDWAIHNFFNFANDFAQSKNDSTFEARLTLGLIRSFTSSTRFELKEEFAKSMYLRAVFLIEKMLAHEGKPWEEFTLPKQTLVN